MKDNSVFRIGFLLRAIGNLMIHPLPDNKELKKYQREYHIIAGENPIYIPKKTKPKGYIKDVKRNNHYNKFRKYE